MEDEDTTRSDDVTIYLVKKSVADEANRAKKRRKLDDGVEDSGTSSGEVLGEIHANSRKLRQCCKYFETCMSERWTSESSSRFQFYLELQTLVLYYEDCFLRINFPYPKPMPSVTRCIELLKVASQIQCQEIVDLGMKYLASVPWTGDRENEIRDFCNSGYFAADSAGDLKARLDLPSDVPSTMDEETHVNYTDLAKKTLSRHMDFALCPYLTGSESPTGCESIIEAVDSRKLFAEAFHCIMSEAESNVCHNLREYFMTLVKEEAEKILVNILKNETLVGYDDQIGEEIFWEELLGRKFLSFVGSMTC